MSYGDLTTQLTWRGATKVERRQDSKSTVFEYHGAHWNCLDVNRRVMTSELADGYEMHYCLARYCERLPQCPTAI